MPAGPCPAKGVVLGSAAIPAATALGPADPADVTAAWAAFSETALSAYDAADRRRCIEACRAAGALLVQLPPNDPRRAAGLNNLGMAALLAGTPGDAERCFAEAGTAWRAAKLWVGGMALQSPARSSLHHLRLEARHRHSYAALLRQRRLRLLTGGRAASLFNRMLCRQHGVRTAALDRIVAQRLWALGPRNPEAAAMRNLQAELAMTGGDSAAAAGYRREALQIAADPARRAAVIWRELRTARDDDDLHLRAAVHLTLVSGG